MEFSYPERYDIEACLTLLTTEEGGRYTPIRSGYRGQFYYDRHDWDAIYDFGDIELVQLGQTVLMYAVFLSPACHFDRLFPQKGFLIREGNKTVGRGYITCILPNFELHAIKDYYGFGYCQRQGKHCNLCHF